MRPGRGLGAAVAAWVLVPGLLWAGSALDLPFARTPIRLFPSKPAYWRYELAEFRATAPAGLQPRDGALEVDLFRDGMPVAGRPGGASCLLLWDAHLRVWRGRWPLPWNPALGGYEARLAQPAPPGQGDVHAHFAGPGEVRTVRVLPGRWLARCPFAVRGRPQAPLPPGFCVVTLEPGPSYDFPAPWGAGRGPMNAYAWARFMGADAFWQCALQTAYWPGQPAADLPWDRQDLKAMRAYAAQAAANHTAFGAYMLTFLVGGDYLKTGYRFTLGYDARTDALVPLRFISMADRRRRREIVDALRMLGRTPGVGAIGLDYLRSNTGGLEFTDRFLADLGLEVPAELQGAAPDQRRLWLGRHLVFDHDRRLHELWDWWRAHRVAQVVKGLLDRARVAQPVWAFTLGWKEGHQHGQDPRMLEDAGVSINAPMFYEADGGQFPVMLGDWRHYLGATGGGLVVGEVVDARLLHPRPGLNGPEELFQRQIETLQGLGPALSRLGFFWHDLNRAVRGGHGPEGMREWALAGAASFARLRQAAGTVVVDLSVALADAGPGLPAGLTGTVRVRNLGTAALPMVRVAGVWTPGMGDFRPARWMVRSLRPGEARDLTFTVAIIPRAPAASIRAAARPERMVAFRAWVLHAPSLPRPDVAFLYWKEKP